MVYPMYPNYCPKCKKWNLFGDLDVSLIVKKQMEKEGTKESADEIYKNKKQFEYYNRYMKERKCMPAGCCIMPNCVKCRTKLIVKERKGD